MKKLSLLIIAIFFTYFTLNSQSVKLNFDGNLEDSSGLYTPTSSGEISFIEEDGRQFCRLSPGSVIEFPESLNEAAFNQNSFEVSFDVRIWDATPINEDCCWNGFVFFSGTGGQTSVDFKLTNFPGFGAEWGYALYDGLDGYTGRHYIIEDPDLESWRTIRLKYDVSKNRTLTSLGELQVDGSFPENFDFSNFQALLSSNQIQLRGAEGSAQDVFIDIDNFKIDAPAVQDNEALKSAFLKLKDDLTGEVSLSGEGKESQKQTIFESLYFADFEVFSSDLYEYTNAYEDKNPPMYENGVSYEFEELSIDDQILQYVQNYVFETQFVDGNAGNMEDIFFEHLEVAPGPVAENTPRISEARVTLNASYNRDIAAELSDQERVVRPTGYYLAAGDIVTIKAPPNAINQGLSIVVGAHFRNMDYDYLRIINRFPDISAEYKLTQAELKVANPFGGGIYLKVPEGTNLGHIEITIENAIKSPYFSWKEGSKTEVSEWLSQLESTGAPWADFESDKFMFTIPTSELEGITNPDEIMTRWDEIMDAISLQSGRPYERSRAEYYTFDTRLVTPAYGAGYPMVIPITEAFRSLDEGWNPLTALATRPNFIFLHEMGHNQLDPTMAYGGDLDPCHNLEAESIVHMLATSVYSNVYDFSVNDAFKESGFQKFGFDQAAFDWIITNNFRTNERMYEDSSAPLEESEMLRYQHRSWAKYAEIADIFGWEALSKINGRFYTPGMEQSSTVCDWRGFVVGRDEYIKAATVALGVNMTPLFHFWGINPSPELQEELNAYPQSPEIKARILEYRENLAPRTLEDYMVYHDLFPKEDYQYPRYEQYLQEFDDEFSADILAQFDFLIETYFPLQRTGTSFISFDLPEARTEAIIDSATNTISIEVDSESDLSSLTPDFSLSDGAIASVNNIRQVSAESAVDFSLPVVYSVLAEDQITTTDWTVTINKEISSVLDEQVVRDVKVSPNPFIDAINIEFGGVFPSKLALYNLSGQIQFQEKRITGSLFNVGLPISTGIYILEVEWEGVSKHYKIVKQ